MKDPDVILRSQIPGQEVRSRCPLPEFSHSNFITQAHAKHAHFAEHEGNLGIKCCFAGQEVYEVGRSRFPVDRSSYLVINHGQRYASSIHSHKTSTAFCVFFHPGFAENALVGLCTPADKLLDDPHLITKQPVQFFQQLYPHDDLVSPTLFRIYQAANQGATRSLRNKERSIWTYVSQDPILKAANPPWLEEQFYLLIERLLQRHRAIYRDIERLPAIRQATRIETFRRLCVAKEFLDSNLATTVTLQELADTACLSPFHFLRQFKLLFQETPHQYHRRKRLERARQMLAKTELPVIRICFDLGFESRSSFSWLFRCHYGLSPQQYRAEQAHNKRIRLSAEDDTKEGIPPCRNEDG